MEMHKLFSKWNDKVQGGASQATLTKAKYQMEKKEVSGEKEINYGTFPEHQEEDNEEYKHEEAFGVYTRMMKGHIGNLQS